MKRDLLCLLFIYSCFSGLTAQNRQALLVGISNYGDESWNLMYPTKDMTDLNRVLRKNGFKTTMLCDRRASRIGLLTKIREMARLDNSVNQLFFFFAGHGGKDYILTADKESVSYEEIVNMFSRYHSHEIYCFIDACHSGSAMNLEWRNASWVSGKKINFCIACRDDEVAAEDEWISNGYFAFALRKGFRGAADLNGDKQITLREMFNYVQKDVSGRKGIQQHPQLIANKKTEHAVIVNLK